MFLSYLLLSVIVFVLSMLTLTVVDWFASFWNASDYLKVELGEEFPEIELFDWSKEGF